MGGKATVGMTLQKQKRIIMTGFCFIIGVNSRHRRKKYLNDDQSEEFKMKAVTIKIKRKLKRQMKEYSATETEEDALVEELLNTLLSDEDFDEDEKERLRRRIKKERRRELRKRKIVKCDDGELFVDGSEGNIITVSTRRKYSEL